MNTPDQPPTGRNLPPGFTWESVPSRTVLEEAQSLIYGERAKDYGPPTASFENIAKLWSAYLRGIGLVTDGQTRAGDLRLTPRDVAHLMILMKVSRNTTGGYKRDNAVDLAGYAGCIERIEEDK